MSVQTDRFLSHLPEIYHANAQLNAFLFPLEAMLLGGAPVTSNDGPGLREIIQGLPRLIDPSQSPESFLPWLAGWVALVLPGDLPRSRARQLIARASQLYAYRGTSKGLTELLGIVSGGKAAVREPEAATLIVGSKSVVGVSTYLGRDMPFYFEVTLALEEQAPDANGLQRLQATMQSFIDLAKPAHTRYKLEITFAPATTASPAVQEQKGA